MEINTGKTRYGSLNSMESIIYYMNAIGLDYPYTIIAAYTTDTEEDKI